MEVIGGYLVNMYGNKKANWNSQSMTMHNLILTLCCSNLWVESLSECSIIEVSVYRGSDNRGLHKAQCKINIIQS